MRKYISIVLILCSAALLFAADQRTLETFGGLNQPIEHWTFPNSASRTGATNFFSADLGKLGYETDNGAYYRLTGTAPTWTAVINGTTNQQISTTYNAVSTDRMIVVTGLATTFTITLQAANSVPPGTTVYVADQSGESLGSINIAASGSDVIWPSNGTVTLTQNTSVPAYQGAGFTSDGTSRWYYGPWAVGSSSVGVAGDLMMFTGGKVWARSNYTLPSTTSGPLHPLYASSASSVIEATVNYPLTSSGTAGYTVKSDGSNFASYPNGLYSSSVSTVSAGYASDTYLAGSGLTIAAGDVKVQGLYHCVFDMTKTAAGTGQIVVTLRMGTAGTTSDAAIVSQTYTAGTAAADTGIFEYWFTFRTVGSGTAAVVSMSSQINKTLTTTGLINSANTTLLTPGTISSGFASTTQTKIGLSFNGGSSFSGTNTFCNCELKQP